MKKDRIFTFKLSNLDREILFGIAASLEQSPSELMRDMIRTEARRLKIWPPSTTALTAIRGAE
jgi:hypothetical protein